ncbi:hypothetical protein [Burkholderia sp. WSM2232]|uniref:hypothetical protein n=1 Tax=Burkholderia sp. WSM2232 TaxID=944436 RepID=UPI000484FA6B|nr:hypothetical protein [Burkholderia sp. WSM2232]
MMVNGQDYFFHQQMQLLRLGLHDPLISLMRHDPVNIVFTQTLRGQRLLRCIGEIDDRVQKHLAPG